MDDAKVTTQQAKKAYWGPVVAIIGTLAIFFGAQIIGGILISLYTSFRHFTSVEASDWLLHSVTGQFVLILVIEVITVAMVLGLVRAYKAWPKQIGLIPPRLKDVVYSLAGFAVYFPLLLLVLNGVKVLIPKLNLDQKQDIGFEGAHGHGPLALIFVSLVVLPPLAEEILVRGFLYTGLRSKLKPIVAGIITSALFATAHLQFGSGNALVWAAALDTLILSAVLVYLREKTGSLWAGIFLHMIKNCIAFLSLFVFHIA